MNKLFRYDSPFMQKMAKIGNLAMLNILYLVCCLPIFTIGAATAAMHAVVYQYILNEDDEVLRPFFKAFRLNFKQATALWLPTAVLIVLLALDAYFLYTSASGWEKLLWIPFAVVFILFSMLMTYAFPMIARYETDLRSIIKNSFLLFIMDFIKSVGMLVLDLVPWVMWFLFPDVYFQSLLLMILYGATAIAYWNDRVMLKIFERRQAKPEE
jgi:uncharacterized membrane protein YesL